jgi:hypothetical protein
MAVHRRTTFLHSLCVNAHGGDLLSFGRCTLCPPYPCLHTCAVHGKHM